MRTAADPMQTGPTQNDLESTYNADISSSDLLLRQKPYGPVSVRVDQRFLAPRAVSLSVSIHSLCYGDRKVPLCEVESCNHVEGARLRVNLANRERPKWFTFSSAAEAAAFCAVTRRCLDHAAPPHASPRSDKKRAGRGVLGGLRALLREKTTPQDDMLLARTFAFSDESTGGGGSAAARSAASARSRSAAEAAQGPGGFEGCAAPRRRPRPLGRVSKRRPTPVLPPLWQVRRKAPARARSLRRPPPSPLRRLLALGRGVKSTRSTDRTWRLLASGSRPAPSP
uniref:Uncharacterized protein n=1 Tax=Emiliania huxleyi TaxID=2903 RepID=A0A6V2UVS3_EMIHU